MKYFFVATLCILTQVSVIRAKAQEIAPTNTERFVQFGLKAETVFPIFIGPSATLSLGKHFESSIGFGLTPEPYYNVIASVAASMGGNSAYEDVIKAAFKNNSIIKFSALYKFSPAAPSWFIGATANQLKANG